MRIGAGGSPVAASPEEGRGVLRAGRKVAGTGQDETRTSGSGDSLELSSEARSELAKLKARDQEVKAHEAAHMSAGGSLVRGGPSYTYRQGPDGKRYAVGGEVQLDASEVPHDPAATLSKAQRLRAAALAPADPSAQDRSVAARASSMAARASADLAPRRGASGQEPEDGQLDTII